MGDEKILLHFLRSLQLVVGTIAVTVFLLSLFAAPGHVSAQPQSTIAKDARLGGDSARTRFVADLSKPTDYRIFTLADPYRVIIDLPNVSFKLPQGIGGTGKGLVSAFRYGLFAPGKSRIVIDVVGPVHVEQSFVMKANDCSTCTGPTTSITIRDLPGANNL